MNKSKIAIIGLGYIGLPLAYEFSFKHSVIGFDINTERINDLNNLIDVNLELSEEEIELSKKNGIKFTNDEEKLRECSIFIVTVPTPIDLNMNPDLSSLINASSLIGKYLNINDLVIYESTVYPGVTRDICIPELERVSGLFLNHDFHCGYSPERINQSDSTSKLKDILKVTSGSCTEAAQRVDLLYRSIISKGTHLVSSIEVAEASKVIENTQRDVNIAFVNEMAILLKNLNIDSNEVFNAASTKWNWQHFRPGLVGGHCISVDPYYLITKSKQNDYTPRLIIAAREVNEDVSAHVVKVVMQKMIEKKLLLSESKVLILGVTFKENCPDIRNSKSIDIARELYSYGITVELSDPWAKQIDVQKEYQMDLIEVSQERLNEYDVIIIAVAHTIYLEYDFEILNKKIIYDLKSLFKSKYDHL